MLSFKSEISKKRMRKKYTFCLLLLVLNILMLYADNIVIKGTVIDSTSQMGIVDVNVFVKGTTVGTITDQSGKFNIILNEINTNSELVFSHIAYSLRIVPTSYFQKENRILLQKRNIPFGEIEVRGKRKPFNYNQEITNIISVIPSKVFDSKGYIDVADILITDQSTIIDETTNGVKTVSIRGANQEEVTVLYDGVRLNSGYDNIFDISLIDPSSLQQIDVIKGSNVTAFSSVGSSAAINFVPKLEQDYLMKFYQRIGTYNSGDWGLNIYKNIFGLKIYAGMKESAMEQRYIGYNSFTENVIQGTANKILNLAYDFGRIKNDRKRHTLQAFYIESEREYDNKRDLEDLSKSLEVQNVKYIGDFSKYGKVNLNLSSQELNESHLLNSHGTNIGNKIDDKMLQFNAEYLIKFQDINFFTAYKMENSSLDYVDSVGYRYGRSEQPYYKFKRRKDGYSAAINFKNGDTSHPVNLDNVQLSIFYERVKDRMPLSFYSEKFDKNNDLEWHENSYMFSSSFVGGDEILFFKSHFNYSVNFRIPTMYQQITSMLYPVSENSENGLMTEYKVNQEGGTSIFINSEKSKGLSQVELSCVLFHSSYKNKFRMIHLGGTPLTFMDNYKDARIFGAETHASVWLKKSCSFHLSYIKYIIPDKAAFPFKPDNKLTTSFSLDLKWIDIDLIYYKESQRAGWIIDHFDYNGEMRLQEIILPKYSNIDVHIKQSFNIWRLKCILSASGRNLINKSQVLQGIAIRDRRFYLTFGLEL